MDKTKHRKAFFALGGLFVVLVLIFSLVQCTQSYSVTFDTDGGNEIPAVSVNKDDTVARPQNPTKNGFTFAYWELDGEEFDFSQPITADIKLKAIWEAKESVYTFGTDRPANFLGSPQVVVTVYKDGTAVSANTVYSNTTVLGDKNNDQGLLLIDESLIDFVNRAQLSNGTFVNVSKGG